MLDPAGIIRENRRRIGDLWYNFGYRNGNYLRSMPEGEMKQAIGLLSFVLGMLFGLIGGAALLAYAYQAEGLYPPDDATIKFIARERGWLKDDV